MATKTTNYGLEKPDGTDFYDVDVQNSNMDIIDKQMKANANAITQLNSDLNNRIEFTITSIDSKYAFTGNSYKHNGKVYINDEELQEDYLQPGVVTDVSESGFDDFVVPENCVFAMGDNRNHSTDCREFGCIPLEKIESKVWIRIWPLNLWGKVK